MLTGRHPPDANSSWIFHPVCILPNTKVEALLHPITCGSARQTQTNQRRWLLINISYSREKRAKFLCNDGEEFLATCEGEIYVQANNCHINLKMSSTIVPEINQNGFPQTTEKCTQTCLVIKVLPSDQLISPLSGTINFG